MIDQEIAKIANDRIRIETEEQNSRLRSEIGRFMIKMRDENKVQTSSSIRGIANLCIDIIKNRAPLVWQTLSRFITTAEKKLWCQILNCELHSSLFTIQDLTPIFLLYR